MAIALDTTVTNIHLGEVGSASYSWSHTITGTNPLLIVNVAYTYNASFSPGTISSLTYNSVALTRIQRETKTSAGGTGSIEELWYLAAPPTGANTVAITFNDTGNGVFAPKIASSSFTGVDQSSPLDTSTLANGTGANPVTSITTGVANALVVVGFAWTDSSLTATTNQTSLYNSRTGGDTGGAASYQIAGAAGSYSDTYTIATSTFMSHSQVIASFKPFTVAANSGFLGLL